MNHISIFTLTFCLATATHALESEHIVWEKAPLHVELPIGKERLIQFPKSIKIIDQEISQFMDVLKVKDSLYIKSHRQFDHSRIIAQLIPDGEVIILNLKADHHLKDNTPIKILIDDSKQNNETTDSHYEYNAIQLTRFAIQALYAPLRLQEVPNYIYRVPMQTHKTVPLLYGSGVEAHPIASWRGGHLYVTAVELKNLVLHPIQLLPEHIIGNWQTVSFYPNYRLPPRNIHESTTVFLVSDKPFHEALIDLERYHR